MPYLNPATMAVVKRGTSTIDKNGETVVEYTYDAWGSHSVSGSNTVLGKLNPFRYRSYFYDTETQLYYLQTRYYDPATGRFINSDSVAYADPDTLHGLNLYAYCGNNPVNYYDASGQFAITVTTAVSLGLVAAGAALLSWIESTYHPIQNAVNDLINDLNTNNSSGNSTLNNGTNKGSSGLIEDLMPLGTDVLQWSWNNNIVYDVYNPDIYARPNQHKQGLELKNKSRKKPGWEDRSGQRRKKPPKKHTPGRDHNHRKKTTALQIYIINFWL